MTEPDAPTWRVPPRWVLLVAVLSIVAAEVGGGRAREIPRLRDAADRLGEGRMLGDVVDALAVEEHRASVPQAADVVIAASHPLLRAATLPQGPRNDKPRDG